MLCLSGKVPLVQESSLLTVVNRLCECLGGEMLQLAEPCKNSLVGRFSFSRPPTEVVRKFFTSLGLKGDCSVGLLDSNHVLIQPILVKGYTRLFVCRTWFIQGSPMVVSK